MEGRKMEISLSDRAEKIAKLNLQLMDITASIKGLKILSESFCAGSLEDHHFGPDRGTPEHYEMIENAFSHIIDVLSGLASRIDVITEDLDLAMLGMDANEEGRC